MIFHKFFASDAGCESETVPAGHGENLTPEMGVWPHGSVWGRITGGVMG
jgi:hypothetical protein